MPRRLVLDGSWAALWKAGEHVSTVLVVLAVHARHADDAQWSGWLPLSVRKVAALARCSTTTVTKALRALEGLSLVERRMVPHRRHPGVRVAHYRLAAALFPRGAEPWTKVPADLVYSRSWPSDFTGTRFRDARLAHLDGAAARHTWLALMAIGPIHDGTAYVEECVSTRLDACVQEALDEFEAEHFPNGVPPVVSAETQERFMAEWDALEWVDFAMLNARDGARAAIEARALAAVPSMKALARLTGLRPSAFVARPSLYHLVNRCSPGDTGGFTR